MKDLQIRNSTTDLLVFSKQASNENIWLTWKAMAQLFDVGIPAISIHLKKTSFKRASWWKIQLSPPCPLSAIRVPFVH